MSNYGSFNGNTPFASDYIAPRYNRERVVRYALEKRLEVDKKREKKKVRLR